MLYLYLLKSNHQDMKTRSMILFIILLVIFDQVTKLIVYNLFMDYNFEVIPHILDFKPVFNGRYSFVNDSIYQRTGMDAGLFFHLILFALIWGILFVYYRFHKKVAPTNKMIDVAFSFFIPYRFYEDRCQI